jgi:hypothetical protein
MPIDSEDASRAYKEVQTVVLEVWMVNEVDWLEGLAGGAGSCGKKQSHREARILVMQKIPSEYLSTILFITLEYSALENKQDTVIT